jgi:hypothetical protein
VFIAVPDPSLASIRQLLVDEYDTLVAPFPDSVEAVERLANRSVMVFVASEPTVPVLTADAPVVEALGNYVRSGGGLLLLGYAARIAYELGLESVPPDRFEPYLWGLDQRTLLGDYRYGIRLVSGWVPELVSDLQAEEGRPHVYLLGGGELVEVQSCHWEGYQPRRGEVLAQLSRTRDGEAADLDPVVLSRWSEGRGMVLAYGSLPEPWREGEPVGSNARQFLRNALRVVCGGEPESVALCVAGTPGTPPGRPGALPPLSEREVPGQVLASHWGWQVGLNYLHDDREPTTPARILEEVMLPSWRAGADLLDLHLPDMDQGYPLSWRSDDRLSRPESFWGGNFWSDWSAETVRGLAREAHARSMLLQTWLAPAPVRSSNRVELLAAMRWIGRELTDLRILGTGALDGVGVQDWFRDPRGFTIAALQDYHPGLHFYTMDGAVNGQPGSVPVLDANRGRPLGLNASGISNLWRPGLLAQGLAAAMLDCRSRRPSPRLWGVDDAVGGGSYGDWIVTQANDFVRNRLGQGPALWWQSFNPATMDSATVSYVQGISMDPIKAAVAGRLWATGTGGYREQLADSVPKIQTGFGAEVTPEASSHFLQNNHFRLHGSSGSLVFDPGGLARFRPGAGQVLAAEFMHTVMSGGRPWSSGPGPGEIDFLAGGNRGESGYAKAVTIRGAERGAGGLPAVLAREEAPRWPRRVDLYFSPGLGLYELQIELRGVAGNGVLELRRDGELVQVIGFRGRDRQHHVLPFPVARTGERQLTLEVVDGGSVALDALRLVRRRDTAAEGAITEFAGHRASLEEWSGSSLHADRASLTTLADQPGFLFSLDYLYVAPSLKVERRFGFLHHKELKESTDGEGPDRLRGPFILASDRPGIPDLAVVPVQLSRHDYFELTDEGLVLSSQPRAYDSLRIGFMFLRESELGALPHLPDVFMDMQTPRAFDLNPAGPVVIRSRLPIPWVRAVKVLNPWGTPYMVGGSIGVVSPPQRAAASGSVCTSCPATLCGS